MVNSYQLWFRTDKFDIIEGEDAETNPFRFGKQLAEWLREQLISKGYSPEEVIPEDWGWCVTCSRAPFMLWVGCGNVDDEIAVIPESPIPKGKDVVWTCYVVAEQSIFSKLFKRIDTEKSVHQLFEQIRSSLAANSSITFVEAP